MLTWLFYFAMGVLTVAFAYLAYMIVVGFLYLTGSEDKP